MPPTERWPALRAVGMERGGQVASVSVREPAGASPDRQLPVDARRHRGSRSGSTGARGLPTSTMVRQCSWWYGQSS